MSEKEFRAELRYRMSLSVARSMLEESVITEEEYRGIDTILLKKTPTNSGYITGRKTLAITAFWSDEW